MNKYYAGIGSRKTPDDVKMLIHDIALGLGQRHYTVRSGGAEGADWAFEYAAVRGFLPIEIYRPRNTQKRSPCDITEYSDEIWHEAQVMASLAHPAWNNCSPYARLLHTRNVFQILGRDLKTPSHFVICWTPDGATDRTSYATGGTGQAIRIANRHNIRVYNLQRVVDRQRLCGELGLTDPVGLTEINENPLDLTY